MAKKKVVMKKEAPMCSDKDYCYCKAILAIIIIILVWWKPAVMWSQIVMTIAALIFLLSGNKCYCKKK